MDFVLLQFQWSPYKFYTIFKQFGEIRSIDNGLSFKQIYGYQNYWVVQFGSDHVAAELLSKGEIVIEDVRIDVEVQRRLYDSISINFIDYSTFKDNTVFDVLFESPDEESPKNITNALNDDCLREIFKTLHLLDLSSIADVCMRFNEIATEVFASKYRNKKFGFDDLKRFGNRQVLQPTLTQIDDFLRNFGPSITRISGRYSVCSTYGLNIILGMINKYCNQLSDIEIDGDSLKYETLIEIIPLLGRLQKLNMYCHSNLEYDNGSFRSLKILCFIGQHCANIQELKCSSISEFYDEEMFWTGKIENHLNQLKNMKKLHLLANFNESILSLMEELSSRNIPIEDLKLKYARIDDDTVKCITQMKTISNLELCSLDNLKDKHLIELAQNLPNLDQFGVSMYSLEGVTMIGIINMLKHANQLSTLNFIGMDRINEAEFTEIARIVRNRTNGNGLNIIVWPDAVSVKKIHCFKRLY